MFFSPWIGYVWSRGMQRLAESSSQCSTYSELDPFHCFDSVTGGWLQQCDMEVHSVWRWNFGEVIPTPPPILERGTWPELLCTDHFTSRNGNIPFECRKNWMLFDYLKSCIIREVHFQEEYSSVSRSFRHYFIQNTVSYIFVLVNSFVCGIDIHLESQLKLIVYCREYAKRLLFLLVVVVVSAFIFLWTGLKTKLSY
jgi:hypothetical protein